MLSDSLHHRPVYWNFYSYESASCIYRFCILYLVLFWRCFFFFLSMFFYWINPRQSTGHTCFVLGYSREERESPAAVACNCLVCHLLLAKVVDLDPCLSKKPLEEKPSQPYSARESLSSALPELLPSGRAMTMVITELAHCKLGSRPQPRSRDTGQGHSRCSISDGLHTSLPEPQLYSLAWTSTGDGVEKRPSCLGIGTVVTGHNKKKM